jgi:hypothetical protein
MISEKTLQSQIMWWCLNVKNHQFAIINNYSVFRTKWECDVLSATASGLSHEFEIKISRSDFLADLTNKKGKHFFLRTTKKASSFIPNYFWFAVPGQLAPHILDDLPSYAGLLVVTDRIYRGHSVCIEHVSAPRLHPRKLSSQQQAKAIRSASFALAKQIDKNYPL